MLSSSSSLLVDLLQLQRALGHELGGQVQQAVARLAVHLALPLGVLVVICMGTTRHHSCGKPFEKTVRYKVIISASVTRNIVAAKKHKIIIMMYYIQS